MNKYFNLCGLTFVIVILIPNIVFLITCEDGFVNHYQNKLVEILEQIGRFGCFISMFFILPFFNKGFWFKNGKTISVRRSDRRTPIYEDFKVHDCKY